MSFKPFLRGRTWWARIPSIGSPTSTRALTPRSLGTENREAALDMQRFLRWLKTRREAWLLHELSEGRIKVEHAYDAYIDGRIEAFIGEARDGKKDPLLEPLITPWVKELERRKKPVATERAKYERQIRTLIGATGGITRLSQLTKPRIRAWLASLDVGQPNRYRAALSSFCEFLILEELLGLNPVRGVPASKEKEPRRRHLSPDEATELLQAIEDPDARALHALMLATGIEVGVAVLLKRRDIDRKTRTVFARGTKRAHRQRTCYVYDRWNAAWAIVEKHLAKSKALPEARVFATDYYAARTALAGALNAKKITDYHTHDHRHTWAVQAVRDGISIQAVAQQLGHRDAVMTLRVYGVFRATGADFGAKNLSNVTISHTG